MVFNLPKDLSYMLEKGMYEQQMAISNMSFMLSQHISDETDDFLLSKIYEELSEKLIMATIAQWCYETEVVKRFSDEEAVKYSIDMTKKLLIVENKHE